MGIMDEYARAANAVNIEMHVDMETRITLTQLAAQFERLTSDADAALEVLQPAVEILLNAAKRLFDPAEDWPALTGPALGRIAAAFGAVMLLLDGFPLLGGIPAGESADQASRLVLRLRDARHSQGM